MNYKSIYTGTHLHSDLRPETSVLSTSVIIKPAAPLSKHQLTAGAHLFLLLSSALAAELRDVPVFVGVWCVMSLSWLCTVALVTNRTGHYLCTKSYQIHSTAMYVVPSCKI